MRDASKQYRLILRIVPAETLAQPGEVALEFHDLETAQDASDAAYDAAEKLLHGSDDEDDDDE